MIEQLLFASARAWSALALFLVIAYPAVTRADHNVTVRMHDGTLVPGELVEYVPGDHVTIDDASGTRRRFATDEVASLNFGAVSATAPTPAASASTAASAPASLEQGATKSLPSLKVQSLLEERLYWRTRRTNLAAPVTLTLLGMTAMMVSIYPLTAAASDRRDAASESSFSDTENGHERDAARRSQFKFKAGMGVLFMGFALLAGGITTSVMRTSTGRQARELQRIDSELGALGARASISPWVSSRRLSARAATSGGLVASLRF